MLNIILNILGEEGLKMKLLLAIFDFFILAFRKLNYYILNKVSILLLV